MLIVGKDGKVQDVAVGAKPADATPGSRATVTWGAAPDNLSPITSYRISWSGGSTTVRAAARAARP